MVRGARWLYTGLAWAFAVGLVVQVFFIGLGLFAGSDNLELHATLGWILHLAPILILAVAALARAGRRQILLAAALAVTVFIVPILVTLRADMPVLAALHPVGALLAFWLAILVALNATRLVRDAGSDIEMSPAT
jgi:mercuric ion transport protein